MGPTSARREVAQGEARSPSEGTAHPNTSERRGQSPAGFAWALRRQCALRPVTGYGAASPLAAPSGGSTKIGDDHARSCAGARQSSSSGRAPAREAAARRARPCPSASKLGAQVGGVDRGRRVPGGRARSSSPGGPRPAYSSSAKRSDAAFGIGRAGEAAPGILDQVRARFARRCGARARAPPRSRRWARARSPGGSTRRGRGARGAPGRGRAGSPRGSPARCTKRRRRAPRRAAPPRGCTSLPIGAGPPGAFRRSNQSRMRGPLVP